MRHFPKAGRQSRIEASREDRRRGVDPEIGRYRHDQLQGKAQLLQDNLLLIVDILE
jgi:hypothetical protein